MSKLTRRSFIASSVSSAVAAGSLRSLPRAVSSQGGRRILTLVYDKSLGMMRAIERVVP